MPRKEIFVGEQGDWSTKQFKNELKERIFTTEMCVLEDQIQNIFQSTEEKIKEKSKQNHERTEKRILEDTIGNLM